MQGFGLELIDFYALTTLKIANFYKFINMLKIIQQALINGKSLSEIVVEGREDRF